MIIKWLNSADTVVKSNASRKKGGQDFAAAEFSHFLIDIVF
jgi:hypothetical protein